MPSACRRHAAADFLRVLGLDGTEGTERFPAGMGPHPPRLPLLDARSPAEFAQGHIPGAASFPLFSDEERASVGTLYKREGREPAMLSGLALVGPRLEDMGRRLLETAGTGKELAVYCSRGGMRSGSIAWLCGTLGIRAHVLDGGYKAFRRRVLLSFEEHYNLLVLGGKTGSGKTDVLHRMAGLGVLVVDLEGLARHRGSAFGAVPDMPQPTSEHFENRLSVALGQCGGAAPIWVEDESENLGKVNVPRSFFKRLRGAPVFFLQTPADSRLERVLKEYGTLPKDEMADSLDRIKRRLGGLEHKRGHACLQAGDLSGLAAILLEYYDRAYAKQLNERPVAATVEARTVEEAAQRLLELSKQGEWYD